MDELKTDALTIAVPAAGCGARAGLDGNKILAPLQGKPLLWWTLRHLTAAPPDGFRLCEVLIAARREEWPLVEAALPAAVRPLARVLEGGDNRQDSVLNLAQAARGEWILVHDAARPLVSADLVTRVCRAARESGAALAALPASDTVKLARSDTDTHANLSCVEKTLDRSTVWLAQTPQVFRRRVLLGALQQAKKDGFIGTDCASLVERLNDEHGYPNQEITLVEGEASNFKVTFRDDLGRAAMLLHDVSPEEN